MAINWRERFKLPASSDVRAGLWKAGLCLASVVPFISLWFESGRRGLGSDDYSHVFIIPLMAIGIVVFNRPAESELRAGRGLALSMWLLGFVFRAFGAWLDHRILSQLGFPLAIIGSTATLFGWGESRPIVFPSLFLLFSLGTVSEVLQIFFAGVLRYPAAGFAHDVLRNVLPLLNTVREWLPGVEPLARLECGMNKTMIMTAYGFFDVVEACSGTRGILALLILGAIIAWRNEVYGLRALTFTVVIVVMAVLGNFVRIAMTLIVAVQAAGEWSFDLIHTFWNAVVFGGCILALPWTASLAKATRFRLSLTRIMVVVLLLAYFLIMGLRSYESVPSLRVLSNGIAFQRTLVLNSPELPGVVAAMTKPGGGAGIGWLWVLTSGLVHSNIGHLLANIVLMFLLGELLRDERGNWMPVIPLLTGQVAGAIVGHMELAVDAAVSNPFLVGASGAVSGLFGAYLVVLTESGSRRSYLKAACFTALFAAGLLLSRAGLKPPFRLSVSSHLAAAVWGCATTVLCMLPRYTKKPAPCDSV